MSGWVTLSTRRPASRVATPVPAEAGPNGSNGSRRNSVVLGPNDRLRGELYIEGDLRVTGTVEGNLEVTGDVEIAGSGKVKGDVTAYDRLTVGSDASLIAGEVRVARLTVDDGATFSGKVSMGNQHAAKATRAPEPTIKAPEPESVPQPAPEPVPEAVALAEPDAVAIEPVVIEPVSVKPVAAKPVQAKPVQAKAVQPKPAAAKAAPVKPTPPKPQPKGKRR